MCSRTEQREVVDHALRRLLDREVPRVRDVARDCARHRTLALPRLERAEEYFRSALEVRKRAFGESSVRTSASYQNIASIATRRGYIPRAIELLGTEPISGAEAVWPSDHFGVLLTLQPRGGPAPGATGPACSLL